MNKEILKFCAEKGFLVDGDLLELFNETSDIESIKLIIEKVPAEQEQTQFLLNNEQWENFNKALECKPKSLTRINKLLNDPGVFDE